MIVGLPSHCCFVRTKDFQLLMLFFPVSSSMLDQILFMYMVIALFVYIQDATLTQSLP